jgi:hypothetical protein
MFMVDKFCDTCKETKLIHVGYVTWGAGKLYRCPKCSVMYSCYDKDPRIDLDEKVRRITSIEI